MLSRVHEAFLTGRSCFRVDIDVQCGEEHSLGAGVEGTHGGSADTL